MFNLHGTAQISGNTIWK